MQAKRSRILLLGALAVTAASTPASALRYVFVHACPCGDRTSSSNPNWVCSGSACECEMAWNDEDNWTLIGYPDDSFDHASITHSTHGCCSDDDSECSSMGECGGPFPACIKLEGELLILLSSKTIGNLSIAVADTPATTDILALRFESNGSAKTLTVRTVHLNAAAGKIILRITDAATIRTETSD